MRLSSMLAMGLALLILLSGAANAGIARMSVVFHSGLGETQEESTATTSPIAPFLDPGWVLMQLENMEAQMQRAHQMVRWQLESLELQHQQAHWHPDPEDSFENQEEMIQRVGCQRYKSAMMDAALIEEERQLELEQDIAWDNFFELNQDAASDVTDLISFRPDPTSQDSSSSSSSSFSSQAAAAMQADLEEPDQAGMADLYEDVVVVVVGGSEENDAALMDSDPELEEQSLHDAIAELHMQQMDLLDEDEEPLSFVPSSSSSSGLPSSASGPLGSLLLRGSLLAQRQQQLQDELFLAENPSLQEQQQQRQQSDQERWAPLVAWLAGQGLGEGEDKASMEAVVSQDDSYEGYAFDESPDTVFGTVRNRVSNEESDPLPPYSGLDLDGDGLAEVDLSLFDRQTGDLNTPLLMLLMLLAALCVTLGTGMRSFRKLRRAMAGCRRAARAGRMVPVMVRHEGRMLQGLMVVDEGSESEGDEEEGGYQRYEVTAEEEEQDPKAALKQQQQQGLQVVEVVMAADFAEPEKPHKQA